MRILVLTQYYWPESFRINELVRSLRANGCDITVLSGQPNYPEGKVFEGYRAWSIGRERHPEGYDIYRVPLAPRGKATAARLAANYLSFALMASVIGPWLLRGKSFDVIFVYEPSPITQAIPGVVFKRVKKARLVTWIQDLWPESLESTGHVRNPAILRAVGGMVEWLYGRHDLLLGQSRSFVKSISARAPGIPVAYFPNPGEEGFTAPPAPGGAKLVLDPGFNVVFAGNLGSVQALDTVLAAAEELRGETATRFVLVGSGSRSDWLKTEIARRGLTNVQMPGRFAPGDMPAILTQASALLVSLIRDPSASQTIPAKVQAYLAAGRPIIAALDGEGAEVVRQALAGLAVPAEDAVALAAAVVRLREMPAADRDRMGNSGRQFYETHFSPDVLARLLVQLLNDSKRPDGTPTP